LLLSGDTAGAVQLHPVLTDLPRMGRRFSETINIDDSHRLHDAESSARLERSELFIRRSSLPQAVKMDVQIAPPPPVAIPAAPAMESPRDMGRTVPPRRFSETVVMELGTRHRSALEFEFQRPTAQTPVAVSSKQMAFAGVRWMPEELGGSVVEERSSRRVDKTTRPQRDDGPPYFVNALEPLRVMDGDRAKLCALVAGSPTAQVSWLHDGKPVKENPDFHLTYNQQTGSVGLEILEVFPQDGGVYECVASNVYGTASVSARLTVEGTCIILLVFCFICVYAFSALTLLVGLQEEHPAVKIE